MGWRTLRRKLQKKLKRKPYRKCPRCGGRMLLSLFDNDDNPVVFKHCGYLVFPDVPESKAVGGCGYYEQLFRHGKLEPGSVVFEHGKQGRVVERQTPTPR